MMNAGEAEFKVRNLMAVLPLIERAARHAGRPVRVKIRGRNRWTTQAELRELARHFDWASVVYRNGTDDIAWID